MSMATMRFRTIVFSASALVLTPLGADEITSHRDSGKPYFLSVDNTLRDDGLLDAKEHLKNSRSLITYIPPAPMRRTPLIRTGKLGTRSPNNGHPVVTLLVPEHKALTAQKRPTLYWHLSEATHKPVVLTLIDLDSVNPLLEEPLQGSVSRGIHALKLADYDIRLQTNKTYEWSVRIVEDPNDPSGDAVARSFIKRVNPNAAILAILEDNNPLSRAQGYARNGIWHDALAALSEDGSPIQVGNRFLHIRDRLLAQVGLLHMLNTPRASVASNSRVR